MGERLTKRIVIVPDTQFPYTDWKSLNAVVKYIGATKPDEVIHIGDMMDFPGPSRWSKGTAEEFHGNMWKDIEVAKRRFLEPLRQVYDGPVGVHEGNHDERPRTYLAKYAPALGTSDAFAFGTLLDFAGFGITLLPDFYDVAPGWLTTHGHLGGIKLSPLAGNTARNAAIRFGKSLIMGHTHKAGITHHTFGYDGKVKTLTGVEVGNLMNMKQAQYLKYATANWQTGFVTLDVDGQHVSPSFVPISGGKFVVDGKTWST
jgi:predicted phosphodiesterase